MPRKSPREIVESIMKALESDPKTVDSISKQIESSWVTALNYLELIEWIQSCPNVCKVPIGERIILWRREWGRLPT